MEKELFCYGRSLYLSIAYTINEIYGSHRTNPIISMWGELSNFSMVLVGHRFVKWEKKDATKFRGKNELYWCKNELIRLAIPYEI